MQTITFNIIKKNRKYYAATLPSGCPCKLEVPATGEDLQPGKHELLVEDISVRTKYGTDVIFRLAAAPVAVAEAGICTLVHRYNEVLVERCRELGGRFNAGAWVFSGIVADKVDELDALYNGEQVTVQVTALGQRGCTHGSVDVVGYPIATATGRDSGAKLGAGVSMISGRIDSGGSVKNWSSQVADGSVFRLVMSRALSEQINRDQWSVEITGKSQ